MQKKLLLEKFKAFKKCRLWALVIVKEYSRIQHRIFSILFVSCFVEDKNFDELFYYIILEMKIFLNIP